MYAGVGTSDTVHKKPCRIEPELCGTSENSHSAHSDAWALTRCVALLYMASWAAPREEDSWLT
jgi:hypothetical protein